MTPSAHAPFLPLSPDEISSKGWDLVDVVFVSGDAYVDHPSFAMALLGRALEQAGFRVALLSQPDWHSCEPFRAFGRPRLFFAVSAGNMDSMVNHYTANKKVRNNDAYSPGGLAGLRPDRATLVYCQRAREAFPGVPIITGGIEASLRRFAHYDYWSDTVRRSILRDAKADLLVYGNGERSIVALARHLAQGRPLSDLETSLGVAYVLGRSRTPPPDEAPTRLAEGLKCRPEQVVVLPSYEEVVQSREAFAKATRLIHLNLNPLCASTLVQYHDGQAVVVRPPDHPLSQQELDAVYALPYTRRPHPSYSATIPAFEMIKHSVTAVRGCFGGCTFCSLTAHQGRRIQSRSPASIEAEVRKMASEKDFKGIVSDVGGPSANMYGMGCTNKAAESVCRRPSCLHPTPCRFLGRDHQPYQALLERLRKMPGVKKVLIASGVRMDLALEAPGFIADLATHHVGGHLKVAPEHCSPAVLNAMKKPSWEQFLQFDQAFHEAGRRVGLKEQYLVPYLMSGHPGTDLSAAIELAVRLKQSGHRVEQVQDFMPTPMDVATCMYYTGLDPMTGDPIYVPKSVRERKWQRALMQYFMPENYSLVREALVHAGRTDLIGPSPEALIPASPPKDLRSGTPRPKGVKRS